MLVKKQEPYFLKTSVPVSWKTLVKNDLTDLRPESLNLPSIFNYQEFANEYFILVGGSDAANIIRGENDSKYYHILLKAPLVFSDSNKFAIVAEAETLQEIIDDWVSIDTDVYVKVRDSPARVYEIDVLTHPYRKGNEKKPMQNQAQVINGHTNRQMELPNVETLLAKRIGDYSVSKLLGQGSFSKVKLGQHINSNEKVAIKCIGKQAVAGKDPNKQFETIRREISLLQGLHHRNVIGIIEVLETTKHICIVQECAENGDLLDYINSCWCNKKAIGEDSLRLFYETCEGVAYIHSMGIAHRDIKPTNILLDSRMVPKLSDFGLSKHNTSLKTACGSPIYAAPELMLQKHYDGSLADVWSLGILFYNMITGAMPFGVTASNSVPAIYKAINSRSISFPEYAKVPVPLQDLCVGMLQVDPAKRMTSSDILMHRCLEFERKELHLRLDRVAQRKKRASLYDITPDHQAMVNRLIKATLNNMDTTKWKLIKVDKDLNIYTSNEPNLQNVCYTLSEGIVHAPYDTLSRYMRKYREGTVTLDEFSRGFKVIEELQPDTMVLYSQHKARLYFTKTLRDFVFLRHFQQLEPGKSIICVESVEHPRCERNSGYVRSTLHPCGWLIEYETPTTCKVTHCIKADLMGNVEKRINQSIINSYSTIIRHLDNTVKRLSK